MAKMPGNIHTINDIAEALGISKSTVSRAFRDTHDINSNTRKRILDFAERHDFLPDRWAQNFKKGLSRTIGVIVPAYNITFYAIAISAIQDQAMKQGYNVMICHSGERIETEIRNVATLINARVEGIIISVAKDSYKNEHIRKLKRMGIPLVLFNRVIEDLRVCKVVVNDYYAAYDMVAYLIKTGCSRIAHISGPSNILLSNNRRSGYLDALKDHGLLADPDHLYESDFSRESGMYGMEKLLLADHPPDAVFCVCDEVAYGAIKVLKDRNIPIPDMVSVAGFTDEPMCDYVDPSLTTVRQPIAEIGKRAAELLLAQIAKKEAGDEFSVLETTIIPRKSTRPLPNL